MSEKKIYIEKLFKEFFEALERESLLDTANGLSDYILKNKKKVNLSKRTLVRAYKRCKYGENYSFQESTLDEFSKLKGFKNFQEYLSFERNQYSQKELVNNNTDYLYRNIVNEAYKLAKTRFKTFTLITLSDYVIKRVKEKWCFEISYKELAGAYLKYILDNDRDIPSREMIDYLCRFIGYSSYDDYVNKFKHILKIISDADAKKYLNDIKFAKEDKKNEWMVYEVAFLWYGFDPPSIEDHFFLMTWNIWEKKAQIHRDIELKKLKMSKLLEYEQDVNDETVLIERKYDFSSGNANVFGNIDGVKNNNNNNNNNRRLLMGVTRYVNREALLNYAEIIGDKPKFLFKSER